MSEHYTKNTVEASIWCKRCRKFTMHRIDQGRRGPCKECMTKPLVKPVKADPVQTTLFGK